MSHDAMNDLEQRADRENRLAWDETCNGGPYVKCLNCRKRSKEADCNNLQCPFCGGNMVEVEPYESQEADDEGVVPFHAVEPLTDAGIVNTILDAMHLDASWRLLK